MLSELERTINARRRVYLLRHGDVSYFDANGAPRPQDEVRLNDKGKAQAQAAAEALAGVKIDRIVVSGLPRTAETASFLLANRSLEPETSSELREISPGRMDEQILLNPERYFLRALRGPIDRETRFLGGETFGSLADRVVPTFDELLRDEGWSEMAIVAHGGTNRAIICAVMGAGLAGFGTLEQDAGCINIIDTDPDGTRLVRLINFTPLSPSKRDLRATTMEHIWLEHLAPKAPDARSTTGEQGA